MYVLCGRRYLGVTRTTMSSAVYTLIHVKALTPPDAEVLKTLSLTGLA